MRGADHSLTVGSGGADRCLLGDEVGARILADTDHRAVRDRRRAEPRQRVGAARAEHRLDLDPAAHREVGPHLTVGGIDPDGVAGLQRVTLAVRARRRHDGPERFDHEATARLDRRRVGRVADQPIAAIVRFPIDGSGRGHAEVGQTGPAVILHRRPPSGGDHPERCRTHPGTIIRPSSSGNSVNDTVMPGRSSAGSVRSTSNTRTSDRPSRCQPPGDDDGYTQL